MDDVPPKVIPLGPARDKSRRHGRLRVAAATCDFGDVVDISASGMRVECARRPAAKVGEFGPITVSTHGESFSVPGRVVWVRRIGLWRHAVGVEFGELSPKARHALVNLARSVTSTDDYLRTMQGGERRFAG